MGFISPEAVDPLPTMGFLRNLGRRSEAETPQMQKARAGMSVSPETVVQYRAARAFLLAEWLGACVMVASFTLLYALGLRPHVNVPVVLAVCAALFLLGTALFWSSHRSYQRVEFPWAKRWDTVAVILAGSGAVFWGLFVFLEILALFGVPVTN